MYVKISTINTDTKDMIQNSDVIGQYVVLGKERCERERNAWKQPFCCWKLGIVNRLISVYWIREPNADWYSNFSVCYGKYLAHYQF